MKKLISIILICAMLIGIAACGEATETYRTGLETYSSYTGAAIQSSFVPNFQGILNAQDAVFNRDGVGFLYLYNLSQYTKYKEYLLKKNYTFRGSAYVEGMQIEAYDSPDKQYIFGITTMNILGINYVMIMPSMVEYFSYPTQTQ